MSRTLPSLLFFCFLPLLASSQPPVFIIDSLRESWSLNPYLSVLELENDSLDLAAVRSDKWRQRFVPFAVFSKKFPPDKPGGKAPLDPTKIYWIKILMQNRLPDPGVLTNGVLFPGYANFIEVYKISPTGTDTFHTGILVAADQKNIPFANDTNRVAFSLPTNDTVAVYLKFRTENHRPSWLDVRLAQRDFYQNWQFVGKTRTDWMFLGFLLTLFFVHLLFFFAASDKAFLFHALFQLAVFIYLLEFFDVLPDLPLLRSHPNLVQSVIFLALFLMDLAYLQFIRTFMRLENLLPAWDKRLKIMALLRLGLLAVSLVVAGVFHYAKLAEDITAAYLMAHYLVILFFLRALFRTGDRKGYFLVAGTLFFIVGLALNAWSVIQGYGLKAIYTQIGVFGEIVLFTWGLGYRLKSIRDEEAENRRLRELDEFKSRFYTNITHEFRTPLTVIQGMAEQLAVGSEQLKVGGGQASEREIQKHKSEIRNHAGVIRRNGEQLLQLINRLLDLSKLQSGKLSLDLRLGDVADYLRYLVQSFHSFAAGKDIQVRYLSELDKFEMDFDALKLQDILSNLLSNAIKFTPPGGEITATVKAISEVGFRISDLPGMSQIRNPKSPIHHPNSEILMISVRDTGVGIPAAALPHVFESYFQASQNQAGGTGIGLTLTKELVELLGGEIGVSSEPGVGATFTILLPVSRQAPPAEPGFFEKKSPAATPLEPPHPLPAPKIIPHTSDLSPQKPLCLIADDNQDIVRYLQILLETDYEVAVAYDGKRAIEKALEMLPDVVISDVMMPEKDGLAVCDFLKNDERTSHIPVILLTAKVSVADRLEGLRRGADAYLAKPFNREELFVCLQKSVELRNRLVAHFSRLPGNMQEFLSEPELVIEDAFLQKARQAVEQNLADDEFDIHHLCRLLTLSRAQLHRKLTAIAGVSATHFIRRIRLQKAKELLATTSLTVSEIAYEVGFRDPNYFSRTFSEEFGEAPSEARR